ncbi:hypothetical protein G6F69_000498 [Rhizopus microsporus]|nr:hypothetical protein G6F69_000498 [Rhizopus microsporus]
MPPLNVNVSISKRFIIDDTMKVILLLKAFVSSFGTTRLTDEKTLKPSYGNLITINRLEVVDEYERHKSSVDTANYLRDNLTSYQDIISTER